MSFTFLFRGNGRRYVYRLSGHHLALVATLAAILVWQVASGGSSAALADVVHTRTALELQKQEVLKLKQKTQQQLTGMLLKLGDMQSRLQRLDALGEQLARQSQLDITEFNLNSPPAMGGPSTEAIPVPDLQSSKGILAEIDATIATLDNKTQQLKALESILLNYGVNDEAFISGKPIRSGWLSSYYGIRKDPFTGMPAMHKGLDFAGKMGSPVLATGAGIVTWSSSRYGYGELVEIDHGGGLVTRYGHNKEIMVKIGDIVTKGQQIAAMGSTGRSTGAHVHYEVLRNGKQLDPLEFVNRESAAQVSQQRSD